MVMVMNDGVGGLCGGLLKSSLSVAGAADAGAAAGSEALRALGQVPNFSPENKPKFKGKWRRGKRRRRHSGGASGGMAVDFHLEYGRPG